MREFFENLVIDMLWGLAFASPFLIAALTLILRMPVDYDGM